MFLLPGSKCQKVVSSGWDSDPLYGKATHLTALEANRILKKLILEGFLWEELVVNKDCGASAYLKLGPKAPKLFSGEAGRIFHQVQVKRTSQERTEVRLVCWLTVNQPEISLLIRPDLRRPTVAWWRSRRSVWTP